MHGRSSFALAILLASLSAAASPNTDSGAAAVYARDPAQPIDAAYTAKIREYTTDPSFNTPLTDYLPAADGVPTPRDALGLRTGYVQNALFGQGTSNLNYPVPFAGQTGGRTMRLAVGFRF